MIAGVKDLTAKLKNRLHRDVSVCEDEAPLPPHIQKYYEDGDLVREAFYFSGTNGIGVLLMHGWSSTPYEFRALGEYLHAQGYTVYAPILSGHGTVPEDLEHVVTEDWIQDVEEAYAKISKDCAQVFVGGMSLGGSLALNFAKAHAELAGLILLGTPYRVRFEHVGKHIYRVAMVFKKYKTKKYPKAPNKEQCMTQVLSYQKYPLANAYEAFQFIKVSVKDLDQVTAPAMIVQSGQDHILTKNSAEKIAGKIGTEQVTKRVIDNAYHNFIGDSKNEYIFTEIEDFIKQHTV